MNTKLARNVVQVIRKEQHHRVSLLKRMHPEVAGDQWLFRDAPFIAELCLMLLVAVRHQVERELIRFAARAADGGKEIEPQQYDERLEELG